MYITLNLIFRFIFMYKVNKLLKVVKFPTFTLNFFFELNFKNCHSKFSFYKILLNKIGQELAKIFN